MRAKAGPIAYADRFGTDLAGLRDDEAVRRADLATGTAEVTWTENGTRRRAPLAELP
jgi:hypothetical protein